MRGLSLFLRASAGMAIGAMVVSCSGGDSVVEPPPGPTTGSLTVTVSGLPSATGAAVTITGPAGFSRAITATETVAGLTPGSYTITAANVTATDGRYAPVPPTQTINVAAATTAATATVTYGLATGSLTITVNGLPAAVNAAVIVTGPNQFTRTLTGTTTLPALEPGTYSVNAAEVTTTQDRYVAATSIQSVTVSAGATPSAAIVGYALATGRLTINVSGLPAGTNAAVVVSGPDGFTRSVTASTVLVQLKPGLYSVTGSNVINGGLTWRATPASQAINVLASTTSATVSLAYAAIDGALTVNVTGLPAGVNGAVTVTGPNGFNQSVVATTTFASLVAGTYTVTASDVTSGATTYSPTPTSQTVSVVVGAAASAIVGYTAPVSLALTQVVTGLTRPVHLVAPPSDPRLFVVEQTGRIRIIQNGQLVTQPFLDVSARVLPVTDSDDEHGLLGLAFHPQYVSNGTFFVFYMDPAQDLVVERYAVSANPNVSNATGTVVLRVPHTSDKSHNGGGLAFGPDGFLYVSIGDGGCCGDPLASGQNLNTLLGKILRINVSTTPYTIPSSNPFVGQAGRRGEIWAYGLRNPWRFDIDPLASVFYVADVGEDNIEEVDAVAMSVSGPNFGWSQMEGSTCFQAGCSSLGLRLPVIEYTHADGCSITGGFVYRGTQIPELQGHYFYSDYCSGFLRSFFLSGGVAMQQRDWGLPVTGFVTSFGRDAAGELYVLTQSGTVFKIVRQ